MLTGSIVAIITPMLDDGSVDYPSLERLVEFHIENGTQAIVSVGTTGESATLSMKENIDVVSQTISMVNKRIPVIAGTGANNTAEAIELTAGAERAGADACLTVTPYYNKPTQEGLFQHFQAIAKSTSLPQLLYNVPGRTGVDMLPETVARLSSFDNIIGIKEAHGAVERTKDLLRVCSDDFLIFSGEDPTACQSMLAGGRGVISVTTNVAPKLMRLMCDAAIAGDQEQALAYDQRLQQLHRGLFVESNPIPVKWACHLMGFAGPSIRLPLTTLDASFESKLIEDLKSCDVELKG